LNRRQARRLARQQREALAWWARPGVLIFGAALALALVGWFLVWRATSRIPVDEVTLDGVRVELAQARWILDQMDHGENFQKPATMMPDMPEWGSQRVTVDLALENRSKDPKAFAGEEFFLEPEIGDAVAPVAAQVGRARLEAGQRLNTTLHFDFDTRLPHGKMRLAWHHGGETVYFPIPEPAEHYHLRPRGGDVALPRDARLLLPIGDGRRGALHYQSSFGCVACHGDPAVLGSNNVGPELTGIGLQAASRIEGVSAAQYIYDSIRDPNAFIAPDCKNGPCTDPSAMPEYASLLSLQDFADVVTYLLEQDGPAAASEAKN
jgi:mono/diheme cytochrome c family protein